MIYPTARAIALAALGAPVALAVSVASPRFWLIGPAWLLAALCLALLDVGMAARRDRARIGVTTPGSLAAGRDGEAILEVAFDGTFPSSVELALEVNQRLAVTPARRRSSCGRGGAGGRFTLTPMRRGAGLLARTWVRWRGPLGLVWLQRADRVDLAVPVTLDIKGVQDEAIRLFSRNTPAGARLQRDLGGGSEFQALRDFQTGMDRRTIDWKQSARHGSLLAKEFHAERNNTVMLVIDTGRLMCEPVAGVPRLDRALNAALLLAYVGLKTGDRVGVFAFGERPSIATGALSGASSFSHLQRLVSNLDYRPEETNYTLGLTALAAQLGRRSLVVVFTEFADTTSAELMLDNVGRLLSSHLVMFVVMRDEELETMVRAEPAKPEDVSRAAVAAALLRERELVMEKLRRLGVHVVDAPADRIGPELLSRYLELKRRDLL